MRWLWDEEVAVAAEEGLGVVVVVGPDARVVLRPLAQVDTAFAPSAVTNRRTRWDNHATKWFALSVVQKCE